MSYYIQPGDTVRVEICQNTYITAKVIRVNENKQGEITTFVCKSLGSSGDTYPIPVPNVIPVLTLSDKGNLALCN